MLSIFHPMMSKKTRSVILAYTIAARTRNDPYISILWLDGNRQDTWKNLGIFAAVTGRKIPDL